jgi:hypothetical protein
MNKRSGYTLIAAIYVAGAILAFTLWGWSGALLITAMVVAIGIASTLYGRKLKRWDQESKRKYGDIGEIDERNLPSESMNRTDHAAEEGKTDDASDPRPEDL